MGRPLMKFSSTAPDDIEPFLRDSDWHLQQKIDGIRARLVVEGKYAEVIGNTGDPLVSTTAAPVTRDILNYAMRNPGCYSLEGEIVGRTWWLFDMPLPDTPWVQRLNTLHTRMRHCFETWIKLVPTYMTEADKGYAWEQIKRHGVEGAVLKHVKSKVQDGGKRAKDVLKCKVTHTADVVVYERGPGNGKDGTGNWLKFGIFRPNGTMIELGRCSTIGKPYAKVGDVIEVKYLYVGNGMKLVQPTHLRNRPDKEPTPTECGLSQLHYVNKKVLEV